MSEASVIAAQVSGGVLRVRIDRPQVHNALSRATLAALGEAFTCHAQDESIRAAVLTGAGDQSFAAGGDLKEFGLIRSEADARALHRDAAAALDAVRRFPAPTVAALNGLAVGGGAELALACDFRVAARHAKIGYVHATLAITSGFGGGIDLARFLEPILQRPAQVLRGYKAMALAERAGEPLARRQQIHEECFARTWAHPDHWAAVEQRAARKA